MASIAQPPYRSSTYSARAVPSLGPPTAEFQAVRDDLAVGWPPQHHRQLHAAGWAMFATATIVLVVYGFVAANQDAPLPARSLLSGVGITLLMLSGVSFLLAVAVRANDRAIIAGAEYGVGEVHGLDTLRGELRGIDAHLSAGQEQTRGTLARLPDDMRAQVGEVLEHLRRIEAGVGGLRDRVEAVERQVEVQGEAYERGWVDGAAKTAEALSGNGQVRQLHSSPGKPPPPRRPH